MPERRISGDQAWSLYNRLEGGTNAEFVDDLSGVGAPWGLWRIDDEPLAIYSETGGVIAFDENRKAYTPNGRLFYSSNLTKRLEELGVDLLEQQPGAQTP